MKEHKGQLSASGKKFAIVASRFNEFVTHQLVSGCLDCLTRHGADDQSIELFWVPGAFEIPPVAQRLATRKKYDAIICLGAVIRGGTPHFTFIAAAATNGIAAVAQHSALPVVNGVLTTDNLEQAIERAGAKAGNKGWDAGLAAIELINLYAELEHGRKT